MLTRKYFLSEHEVGYLSAIFTQAAFADLKSLNR